MVTTNKCIKMVLLLSSFFLLGGILHMALYGVNFADNICQIYYGVTVLLWGINVERRVTDKRVRSLLFGMVVLLLLQFFLQACRYKYISGEVDFMRYVCYAYYIPIFVVPLLFLYVSLCVNKQEDEQPIQKWKWLCIPCAALIGLVITNDYHQLVFRFSDMPSNMNGSYSHGVMFYVCYVWVAVIYLSALIVIAYKCRIPAAKKQIWLPLFFAGVGVLGLAGLLFNVPSVNGILIWQMIESFAFMVIGIAESCISLRLIPSCTNYEDLFASTVMPVRISDADGQIIYSTEYPGDAFADTEHYQISARPIFGGQVSWAVDVGTLQELGCKIKETTEQIERRNVLLHSENSLKEEHTQLQARNKLYDRIAEIVKPQLHTVRQYIQSADETNLDDALAKIAVLKTYIKRRSNLELLKADNAVLSTKELSTAISESCDILKYCGIHASLVSMPDEMWNAEKIVFAYDFFEWVIEECLTSSKSLMITAHHKDGITSIRFTTDGLCHISADTWQTKVQQAVNGQIGITTDEGETTIILSMGRTVTKDA